MESSLVSRAEMVLAQPDHKNAAALVSQIYQRSNREARESANALYRFCSENFPNCLTLTLLKVYRFSVDDAAVRSQSLTLLHSHLSHLYNARIQLVPEAFGDIKPLLVSCLLAQETREANFKILSRITSFVALDVFLSDSACSWDELCSYIASLADRDLRKAVSVFSDLPTVLDEGSLMLIVRNLFPLILKRLNSLSCAAEDWISALVAGFLIGVQLANAKRSDLGGDISYAILSSSCELVRNGKEATVRGGLYKLSQKVDEEVQRFHKKEYRFVSSLALKMENLKGIEEATKKAARNVHRILQEKCWDM